VIDTMSRSLVNKLLHNPTIQLRNTPQLEEIYKQAEMLSNMFNIPPQSDTPESTCGTITSSGSVDALTQSINESVKAENPYNVLPLVRKQS
jgi:hypothetical protein